MNGTLILDKEKCFRVGTNISKNSSTTNENNRHYIDILTDRKYEKNEVETAQAKLNRQ